MMGLHELGRTAVLLVVWLGLVCSEEWFMPDSHLISDAEYQQLVLGDATSFKIVKYFSPHCQYCRYLKVVMDKLKHEK